MIANKECPKCGSSWDVDDDVLECPECFQTPLVPGFQPSAGHPYRLQDVQPLRDRILVAPLAVASRSRGGIHLAETSHEREQPQQGIVLLIGPGGFSHGVRLPMTVRRGDCVAYGKYSGQEFTIGDRRVLNMAEAEVFTRLPVGCFQVKEHDNPKDNHLVGDWCDLCASPAELEAKAALAEERKRLVADRLAAAAAEHIAALNTDDVDRLAEPSPSADAEVEARSALDAERERLRVARAAKEAAES